LNVIRRVSYHQSLFRSATSELQYSKCGVGIRLTVWYVVDTYHGLHYLVETEGLYKAVEGGSGSAAADGQLQPATVQFVERLLHMREERYRTGVVVLVEEATIDLAATLGQPVVGPQQLYEALLQWQPNNGSAFGIRS
jgi:hypothetical protein